MGKAHAICVQEGLWGWCDLWYIAGEVGWWVVVAGAWGEVVIKVGWVVVIGVSWGVASQGPPLPALKDGLCGGLSEGMVGSGGVPTVGYVLSGSIWGWLGCGWGWGGSELGGCWLGGSVGEVECVPDCGEVDGSCVLTIGLELCLNYIQFALCGAVAGGCG